jgi:hypothetical protein
VPESVIYFPRINPPDSEWFTRVLLYWDEVGTIVPIADPNQVLDDYTRGLVDAGLVKPVVPAMYMGRIPRFESAFLDLIDHDPGVPKSRVDLNAVPSARIHVQKFGEGLAEELQQRGLARPAGEYGWFEVERRTGHLFMTYLATALGSLDALKMTPITDTEEHLKLLSGAPAELGPSDKAALKVAVLAGALPAPAEGVPAEEIAKFKSDHSPLLLEFREEVTRRALEATKAAPGAWVELAEVGGAEMGRMAAELTRSMEARNWKRIGLGALGVVGAGLALVDAIATGGAVTQLAAGTGLVGSAWSAVDRPRAAATLPRGIGYSAAAAKRFSAAS